MNFEEYMAINNKISSEMFYSIMAQLHEKLPCSANIFRKKNMYKLKIQGHNGGKSQSPLR